MYATSLGNSSFDDKTASVGEHVARVSQSHFGCGGNDPRPTGGISMETRSKRRCSIEIASASSKSYTVSSGATSQCRPVRGRGPPEERSEMMTSSLTEIRSLLGLRSC